MRSAKMRRDEERVGMNKGGCRGGMTSWWGFFPGYMDGTRN